MLRAAGVVCAICGCCLAVCLVGCELASREDVVEGSLTCADYAKELKVDIKDIEVLKHETVHWTLEDLERVMSLSPGGGTEETINVDVDEIFGGLDSVQSVMNAGISGTVAGTPAALQGQMLSSLQDVAGFILKDLSDGKLDGLEGGSAASLEETWSGWSPQAQGITCSEPDDWEKLDELYDITNMSAHMATLGKAASSVTFSGIPLINGAIHTNHHPENIYHMLKNGWYASKHWWWQLVWNTNNVRCKLQNLGSGGFAFIIGIHAVHYNASCYDLRTHEAVSFEQSSYYLLLGIGYIVDNNGNAATIGTASDIPSRMASSIGTLSSCWPWPTFGAIGWPRRCVHGWSNVDLEFCPGIKSSVGIFLWSIGWTWTYRHWHGCATASRVQQKWWQETRGGLDKDNGSCPEIAYLANADQDPTASRRIERLYLAGGAHPTGMEGVYGYVGIAPFASLFASVVLSIIYVRGGLHWRRLGSRPVGFDSKDLLTEPME